MEPSNIPSNNSNEQLMGNSEVKHLRTITKSQWFTIIILCYVNLINYMDRYTVAGIMTDIKSEFSITDDKAGLLQTVFIISYMVFAPVFGYLGDRYNRKLLMAFGVFLWGLMTIAGSFMNAEVDAGVRAGKSYCFGGEFPSIRRFDNFSFISFYVVTYNSFLIFRAFVGIGEASYSTIAPTIISDFFTKDLRAKMLALFYFAIPVGSGLGYIVGSKTAKFAGSWHWALRVTPIMAGIAVIAILLFIKDPERGESEGRSHLVPTSWKEDIEALIKNRSFMYSTVGFMCVAFVTGALAWWGPVFIYRGVKLQPGKADIELDEISFSFGWIAMLAGILGVPLGSILSQKLRFKIHQADPLICGIGILISTPLFVGAMLIARFDLLICYFLLFFGQLAINLNWSITADILLYVVIPTRRSTAEAFQILVSHAFGDAGSPYFVGALADFTASKLRDSKSHLTLYNVTTTEGEVMYYSLQYALFTTSFVEIIGGIFFLITAAYIIKDRLNAEREIRDDSENINPNYLYADETSNNVQ